MKTFITDDFLLTNEFAKVLYHDYAKDRPILDYHNHLPPQEIAQNRVFENISQVWLAGDHYKWRAMRALGIDERYITGNATDQEKFLAWGKTAPYTVRNPLYHWTQLELQRYFEIEDLLNGENAASIYDRTTAKLQEPTHCTVQLLEQQNVEVVCTTDDPVDSLEHHKSISEQGATSFKVFPAFRPDKAYTVENTQAFIQYLEKLEQVVGKSINSYSDLLDALRERIDFFHKNGCRLSDHGLEQLFFFEEGVHDCKRLFGKLREGKTLSPDEVRYFKCRTQLFLCRYYHEKGWTQQFHLGAIRNNNERLLTHLGPDTGFDSIGDFSQAKALSGFLNDLDKTNELAKTVVYNLNPADNEVMATMMGNFNDGTIKGKMQFGSGWWFLDQKDGMEKQLNALSNMGLLSCFVGMLTDSRSFLSFPRHEYFRRILCNLIGKDVANGELPADEKWLGKIVSDICYQNAKDYFNFPD